MYSRFSGNFSLSWLLGGTTCRRSRPTQCHSDLVGMARLPPASRGRSSPGGLLLAPCKPRSGRRQNRNKQTSGSVPPTATHADQRPVHPARHQGGRLPGRTRGGPSLPSQQFQVLFNSLFKVLFIFPSRYLFAIGLPSVFSLRWDLPPPWGCIPKQPDSTTPPREVSTHRPHGVLTLSDAPFQGTWASSDTENGSLDYNSPFKERRFSRWAIPGSLAVTKGILVSFFSSAY